MAKGVGGTGAGFDAASAGRLGSKGFGAHDLSPSKLRAAMVKVRQQFRNLYEQASSYALSIQDVHMLFLCHCWPASLADDAAQSA